MSRRAPSNHLASVAVLMAVLIACPPAAAQYDEVGYGSAFTDGIDWALDGLWAVDAYPIQGSSPSNCLNFNNASGNFAGVVSGTARSPIVDAGQADWLHLHFACRYQTGTQGTATDQRWLRIVDFYNNTTLFQGQLAGGGGAITCPTFNQWHTHTLDLSPYTARYLRFEFFFNSVDANNNSGNGWHIDNFIVHIVDLSPPDAIANLSLTLPTKSMARLTWTSPWDRLQGLQPGATFELRYSTTPITEESWNFTSSHNVYDEPTPGPPGTFHTLDVFNLEPGKAYYFAIRTRDVAGNVSPLSNIATVDTAAPPLPSGPQTIEDSKSQGYLNPECSAGTAARPDGLLLLGALVVLAAAARKLLYGVK